MGFIAMEIDGMNEMVGSAAGRGVVFFSGDGLDLPPFGSK